VKPRTAEITGWMLAGATVGLCALGVLRWTMTSSSLPWMVVALIGTIPATFSLTGALIVSKRPDNGLGWLFAVGGFLSAITACSQVYYDTALAADINSSTGRFAAWTTDVVDPFGFGLITGFVFLLYPTGHLEGRGERRVATVAIAGLTAATVGALVEPNLQEFPDIPTPFALAVPSWVASSLVVGGLALALLALIASVVLLIRRLRRSAGREREQLRLLVWASVLATVLVVPALALPPALDTPVRNVAYLLGGLGLLLIPFSVGIAILRHRFLDIDLVIKRTLVVALVGAFITAVYFGLVVGVGTLVGSRANPALSAMAAAVVALAFQPVRRWAQRFANRLVYGDRATPYEVMHTFSERVAGSYRTLDVLPRMAAVLGEGTGARRAQVWLRVGSELQPSAVWPKDAPGSSAIPAPSDRLPTLPGVTHAVAVRDEGDLLGALSITKEASDPPSPSEERLVGDLALQAGLVLRNVQLVEDLRASRQRLVSAQDEARRRIERNLHDGAQQQLVALAVKARLVDTMVDRDAHRAHELAREIQTETQDALESLRELARGIYPALLADRGLVAAVEAQARKSPATIYVHAERVARQPIEIETAAYFCCLEALQNVGKYAQATRVDITLAANGGELTFEVRDDGIGFDPETTARGSGLQNMTDRLAALDGTVSIRAAPGEGTTVFGRIPIVAAVTPPGATGYQSASR
jgi:signal transduction histidine kinase